MSLVDEYVHLESEIESGCLLFPTLLITVKFNNTEFLFLGAPKSKEVHRDRNYSAGEEGNRK